jgi:hypothetical protein
MYHHGDLINIEIFGDSLLVETLEEPSDKLREDISRHFPKTTAMIIISKDDPKIMRAVRAVAHRLYIIEERLGDFVEGLSAEQDEKGAYISVLTKTPHVDEKTLHDELSLYFSDIRLEFDNMNAAQISRPAPQSKPDQHKPTL